jgi:hypothetical protein
VQGHVLGAAAGVVTVPHDDEDALTRFDMRSDRAAGVADVYIAAVGQSLFALTASPYVRFAYSRV